MSKNLVLPKTIGFAGVGVVAALTAVVMHFAHSAGTDKNVDSRVTSSIATASPSPQRQEIQTGQGDFSWLADKYPSDVVNDRRFKAAFRNVSRSEWKKISERPAG
jgi:hypothetical protein